MIKFELILNILFNNNRLYPLNLLKPKKEVGF